MEVRLRKTERSDRPSFPARQAPRSPELPSFNYPMFTPVRSWPCINGPICTHDSQRDARFGAWYASLPAQELHAPPAWRSDRGRRPHHPLSGRRLDPPTPL